MTNGVNELFEIIHEDAELLVINKPAGLVCHPTKTDARSSLIGRVRLHLDPQSPAHLVNRLDRETSGVVIVARQDAAARELRRLWEAREVEKEYMAIVHGHVRDEEGLIEAPLGKDERSRVAVKDCVRPDGLPAQTTFRVMERFTRELPAPGDPVSALRSQPFTLLRVQPRTGRKHQIRIHLAHVGHPIVGDKLYGGDEDLYMALVEDRLTSGQRRLLILPNQALHARAVRYLWRGQPVEYCCNPDAQFVAFIRPPSP